jgi:hypothetical protein
MGFGMLTSIQPFRIGSTNGYERVLWRKNFLLASFAIIEIMAAHGSKASDKQSMMENQHWLQDRC